MLPCFCVYAKHTRQRKNFLASNYTQYISPAAFQSKIIMLLFIKYLQATPYNSTLKPTIYGKSLSGNSEIKTQCR